MSINRQFGAEEGASHESLAGAPPLELPPRREGRAPTGIGGAPGGRATPRQFLHEVNVEMRKVAWPTRASTVNYSTVVFVTLAILMALIFVVDLGFSKLAIFLFK
ncbi:MAG: preprotein translocase subunit SecE [Acidimicrobiales bacterium]